MHINTPKCDFKLCRANAAWWIMDHQDDSAERHAVAWWIVGRNDDAERYVTACTEHVGALLSDAEIQLVVAICPKDVVPSDGCDNCASE